MPSPCPTSRRSSSSASPRNLSGSTRADLLAPRSLHQGLLASSTNSAASRALHEKTDDHKENSTEHGDSRGAHGKSNQNLRGISKKPWVTHFAKPATTLSPGSRILVDRNSTCSPVRSGSVTTGNGETFSEKIVPRATTPRDQREEEAPATPGPVKGVAELSKRIQQFLDDQDVLLGIKTGTSHEVTSTCVLVTPIDPGQRTLSSPYNPYKSPFFERPKFLRLNGNASSMEGAEIATSVDEAHMLMEQTTEELSLFERDQALVTPLQQVQFSTSFSQCPTADEEVGDAENSGDQISEAAAIEEASVDALEANVLPNLEDEVKCLHELKEEISKQITDPCPELRSKNSQEDELDGAVPAESQLHAGNVARQAENQMSAGDVAQLQVKDDKVLSVSAIFPRKGSQVSQDEDQILSKEAAESDEVDLEDVSWGKKAAKVLLCGTLLAAFLALALLSSAGPGLVPPSLVNNPVNSLWHTSKYHEQSMMFVRGMDGLWSTEMIYLPADVRVAVLRGSELLQSIRRLSHQANQELQRYVQLTSSIFDDWSKVLVQHLSLSKDRDMEGEHEDRGRQFEWIQEYEFEEEWLVEIPMLAYTDWELLHEYDLEAANQFVLGSIPEILKNDLRRNFSRLSASPEVKGLLEDLMKLKGGSTEEDRLEVLQYFWEYTRFSASAHESFTKFQVGPTAVENGSTDLGFPSYSELQNVEYALDNVENVDALETQGPELMQYQTPTEEDSKLTEGAQLDEQHLDLQAVHLSGSKIELSEMAPETRQESQALAPTTVSTVHDDGAAWMDAIDEWQSELAEAHMLTSETQTIQSTSDVKLALVQLATIAIFIVACMFTLGHYKQSTRAGRLISPTASVQFLRKTDQPPKILADETQQKRDSFAKQDKQQVTMIEELNDRFVYVLQSPEPTLLHQRSPHTRKDEDLIRSPIAASATSPYGSFTTYKLMAKKEGRAVEAKLTPVRRSSRIRNHVSMSPNGNEVKRIAISPP